MKKVLCICPQFPPVNAADMQRLRQSLPYFRELGWDPVVFAVDPEHVEGARDDLLLQTIPHDVPVHHVGAFGTRYTRKVGLGNLGFRCVFQLRKAVDRYLRGNHVDLVYFSTTVFTVMALGPRWKRKYGVPFIVDLQDPWRNDYYLSLPADQRPRKFWFDYRQKKLLEARTMPQADGIIAVSGAYIDTMRTRYPELKEIPAITLPFGGLAADIDLASRLEAAPKDDSVLRVVYAGRGGKDMARSLSGLFSAFAQGLTDTPDLYGKVRFDFYGTSYAASGRGAKTITPIAERFGVADYVREETDRLPYFQSLRALLDADCLFVPGSDDPAYTASKLFPYILAKRPLMAVFHEDSSVVDILRQTRAGAVVAFGATTSDEALTAECRQMLDDTLARLPFVPDTDWAAFEPYTAREMTRKSVTLFNQITDGRP